METKRIDGCLVFFRRGVLGGILRKVVFLQEEKAKMTMKKNGKRLLRGVLTLLAGCVMAWRAGAQEVMEWRGVMLDVSRHFMPIEDVRRQVDAMSRFGLNVLHLHLTDAAGWRMEIKKYPRLTEVGAWRPVHDWETWWNGTRSYGGAHGGYYTQDELRGLVDYAAERGVTVVPEIEFPAHSEEVVAAYPHLGYNHAELDMSKDSVYLFFRDVLEEVAEVFPSPYLHLGGDEAATQHDLQPEGMRRMRAMVESLGRRMVVWDEAFANDVRDTGMVIMVWRDIQTATRARALGHDVVLSPGRWLYLDKAQDAPHTQPRSAGGYLPIDSLYTLPLAEVKAQCGGRLLGVQANLWTEYMPSVAQAEYMLWPRAYAVSRLAKGLGPDREAELAATRWLRDTLGVNAFDLAREIGQRPERSTPVRSLATGCPVRYLHRYHAYYPAAGEASLTDGLRGGWSNIDGRWQGFIGQGGMDVVIDLGRMRKISQVGADFLQSRGPEIFLPGTFLLTGSRDGKTYFPLHSQEGITSDEQEVIRHLAWRGPKQRLRYLRVQALPSSRQGWVFCDEVVVW